MHQADEDWAALFVEGPLHHLRLGRVQLDTMVVSTGSYLKTSLTMVMYHAGVAAMMISYLEKELYNLMMFMAKCKMMNFESSEGLSTEIRCSVQQVVHHTGVGAKLAIKMMKQIESVMQKNREVDEKSVQ